MVLTTMSIQVFLLSRSLSRACFRENKSQLGAQMLEPIMKVEVVTPEEYLGDCIIGNLNSRRGMIQGQEVRGIATVVNAHGSTDEHV